MGLFILEKNLFFFVANIITFDNVFDSFLMFSFNGKKIAFSSNRGNNADPNAHGGATNVFVADWVD